MLILAAEEASDTFWTAMGAVGAVLAIPTTLFIGWLAYRAVWPRRKVRWSARVSPLMSHSAAHNGGLQVAWTGAPLVRPHIVEVELTNVGNKDLEPAHFNALPVEITSTAPVVALLQEASEPSVQRVLTPSVSNRGLSLATSTPLHKGQSLTYVMLVDGARPKIDLRASVSNASFDRRDPPSQSSEIATTQRVQAVVAIISALAATATGVLAQVFSS
ncbi:hypothetical protein ACFW5M_30895 [Streptomyces albogriseolus]|uniref:hypothetical protein n=1 Tax=Streptomyces albogriseolus TaxID=1887 RepID=UPI0036AC1FFD